MLFIEGSLEWTSFANKCSEDVGDVDVNNPSKKVMHLSLTLEKLIREAEFRGASREQLGKIILLFLKAKVPDVATKINSHSEVTKEWNRGYPERDGAREQEYEQFLQEAGRADIPRQ